MNDAEHTTEDRAVVELPVTIHKNPEGLHLWFDDDEYAHDAAVDDAIVEIEREVFGRLPDEALEDAKRGLTPESERVALGRDAPTVAVVEYYPDDGETGGVALDLGLEATVVLFPREGAGVNSGEQA